jgi:hypothetical protein
MSVRTRLFRWLSLRRLAGLLLLVLMAFFFLKLGARVERKRAELLPLNPIEQATLTIVRQVRVNPLQFGEWWAEIQRGLTQREPQPPMPQGITHRIGQDTLPLKLRYLYSYYDPAQARYVVELLDLATNRRLHRWTLSFDTLRRHFAAWRGQHQNKPTFEDRVAQLVRYRLHSPLLLADNHLLVMCQTMLLHLDAASNIVWRHDKLFHHSIERAADGNVWVCSVHERSPGQHRPYRGDQLVKLAPATGEILFRQRVDQLLQANPQHDYSNFSVHNEDPFHLNDIQPVRQDGPFWQKGDVFISLRNVNAVLLYRPATNKVLWSQATGWYYQHDVNILNDSTLSLFNNNWAAGHKAPKNLPDEFITYNFATDSTRRRFKPLFQNHGMNARIEGRAKLWPQDSILYAEATKQGFFLLHDLQAERTYKCAIPGWAPGKAAHLGWFRIMPP